MKYLNKKLRRDILHNLTQFFSVFLMAFLSVLIFSGLQGAWHGLEVSVDDYIKKSNLPQYWVYGINIDEDEINTISQIDGIKEIHKKTEFNLDTQMKKMIINI